MKFRLISCVAAISVLMITGCCNTSVSSPDGKIIYTVETQDGKAVYTVKDGNQTIISNSALGFIFKGEEAELGAVKICRISTDSKDETWEQIWGEERFVRNNYNEMTANDLPTDINGLTADFSPSKNFFASTLQRKGVKTTYDAITGIDGYLEGVGNLIYHTEDIQRLRAYEQYIRDTYGENHGFDNIENLTDEEKAERIEKY